MFQTHTFQAFNTLSLANLTCTLNLNQTQSQLSTIVLDYHVSVNQKYRLTIFEKDLSYDMKFVISNLKGFFEYLKSIHQKSQFNLCSFSKNKVTVLFLLKIFNQEQKIVKQEFHSTEINDQLIWKSELKEKINQLQVSMSKNISYEINRKVKDQILQEQEISLLKFNALDKKLTRQLENINKKVEKVFDLITNSKSFKKDQVNNLQDTRQRYRGRFNQQDSKNKDNPSNINVTNPRTLRKDVQKTKPIYKPQNDKRTVQSFRTNRPNKAAVQENQPQDELKQNKFIQNNIIKFNQTRKQRKILAQRMGIRKQISKLQKQYRNFGSTNIKKGLSNQNSFLFNDQQPQILDRIEEQEKFSRNNKNSNGPFLIQKIQKVDKNQNQNLHSQKYPQIQSSFLKQKIDKHSPREKSEKKSNKPQKQPKNQSSPYKVQKKKQMVDQKQENSSKKRDEKEKKSLINHAHDLRNKFFQKNMKKGEIIDLQNEQQMEKFKIRIVSQEASRKVGQKVKKQEIKENMNLFEKNEKKNRFYNNQQTHDKSKIQITKKGTKFNFIDQIMHSDSSPAIIPQKDQQELQSQEINNLAQMVQTYKKNKIQIKKTINQESQILQTPLKITQSGMKNEDSNLNQLIDPSKQIDFQTIAPLKVPSYEFLTNVKHFQPKFYPQQGKNKLLKYNLKDYFSFDNDGKRIQKVSKFSKSLKDYISLVSSEPIPNSGRYFMALRILKSLNYHICIGIVDMPSQIKVNQIPKNCDAIYVLDGGLHDQKGGSARQNGWRAKEGKPVDVFKMQLLVEKGELYVITVIDMEKEQIEFYYNEEFISKTKFSSFCRKNKHRIHAYIAMRNEKDCIEIV